MPGISRFDDIDGLIHYWNPGDVPPNVETGVVPNEITTWPPGYPTLLGSGDVIPNPHIDSPDKRATYDAATDKCGLAPAVRFSEGQYMRLYYPHAPATYPNGSTVLIAYTRDSMSTGVEYAVGDSGSNRSRTWPGNENSGEYWLITGTYTDKIRDWEAEPGTPTTIVVRQQAEPGDGEGIDVGTQRLAIRKQGESTSRTRDYDGVTGVVWSDEFGIGSRSESTFNLPGVVAIFAVYDRALSDQDMLYVQDLMHSWIDNGFAPDVTYETSTFFGPVLPNDMGATLIWEVLLDSDSGSQNWQAYTVLSNASLVTEPVGGGTIEGNKLLINSATPEDACQVRCRAVTSYNASGIITKVDTLVVRESS